jgi:hypothetical protein
MKRLVPRLTYAGGASAGRRPRSKVWATLLAVAAAVLVFAAPAAAEVRTGHANAPEFDAEPGEADIVAASASYDTSTGAVTFTVQTRDAPSENPNLRVVGRLG